ncbi:hypothetical protein L6164_011197 [Bauhinia variegata]|uniref:Uncharacterized protein n=1 Tax=Bauhinia variegata TaxID=167791 RepID=A0ACB9P507_BAUVA|nr:hypothetical protein L6164_011197 [Bauhinia variegata]
MSGRKIEPNVITFSTLIDGFCKIGNTQAAMEFVHRNGYQRSFNGLQPCRAGRERKVPFQKCQCAICGNVVNPCSLHGDIELGAVVHHKLLELEANNVGDSVAIPNIYANKGMWHKMILRNQIEQSRTPGCSSIEV